MTSQWRKLPSATSGGKPFYYRLYTLGGQWAATIVWNRSVRAYAVETAKRLEHGVTTGMLSGYVSTVGQGKALVARLERV